MTAVSADVQEAARHVAGGGLVCFPTETLWSLSCLPSPQALDALRAAKGRPSAVPLAVGFSTWEVARKHVATTPAADALARRFLPGPLSIVLRRTDPKLAGVAPGLETLSVRIPDHPLARTLLAATGPLVMTSANRHGMPDPRTRQELAEALSGSDVVVVGDGPVPGTASTVVDATGDVLRVLREGVIPKDEVDAAWP